MKIFHNPRCAKSRDTLKILMDKGVDVDVVEYLKEVPTHSELSDLLQN